MGQPNCKVATCLALDVSASLGSQAAVGSELCCLWRFPAGISDRGEELASIPPLPQSWLGLLGLL